MHEKNIAFFQTLMHHSPFRQTLKLGILIGTAEESILILVKLGTLASKHCKYSPVKFANFVKLYFCIMRGKVQSDFEMWLHFSAHNTKVYKFANFTGI